MPNKSHQLTSEQLREEAKRLRAHSRKLIEKADRLAELANEIIRKSEAEKKRAHKGRP